MLGLSKQAMLGGQQRASIPILQGAEKYLVSRNLLLKLGVMGAVLEVCCHFVWSLRDSGSLVVMADLSLDDTRACRQEIGDPGCNEASSATFARVTENFVTDG